jgi:hypothetical protein
LPDWLQRYDHVDIPVPAVTATELAAQPRAQHILRENMETSNFDSVAWRSDLSRGELLRLRRHYAANVSMIDERFGQGPVVASALKHCGYPIAPLWTSTVPRRGAQSASAHASHQKDPRQCAPTRSSMGSFGSALE